MTLAEIVLCVELLDLLALHRYALQNHYVHHKPSALWSMSQYCRAVGRNITNASIITSVGPSKISIPLAACRYIMTIDIDGSKLWRVPLVSGQPAGLDYGSQANLIISENSTTFLVYVGKGVRKLSKPAAIAKTEAGPCKFHPHNNRSRHIACVCTALMP